MSISLIESNDCRLEEISEEFCSLIFIFKKEHKYFYTKYECIFDPVYFRKDRVFYDCIITNNYDKLLRLNSFKKLIKDTENKTGFTFLNCGGGYTDVDFEIASENFMFNNKYRVFARFKIDENKIAVYDIDLDKMELSKEYCVY
jgi:hypothetical protein